jgi:WhiB family redox-sensing transcriptional regulator
VTEFNDFQLYDVDADPFDEPSTKSADVIDIRKVLIDELAADAPDDDAVTGRLAEDLDWQDEALCKESDPEAFFPEKGGSTKQAKAVCKRCPITEKCLQYALDNDERYGIWGGKSERERRQILNGTTESHLGRVG